MQHVSVAFLTLALALSIAPSARADAIPGDSACHVWEHWQGAHGGSCRLGPRCSISSTPGASDHNATLRWPLAGIVIAVALTLRARSR